MKELNDYPYIKRRQFEKKTLTLPRQNCNSMAVFAVTVCSVFTTLLFMPFYFCHFLNIVE